MQITACECPEPGWCNRHRCTKSRLFHYFCQYRADYFQAWEEARGPGQEIQARAGPLPPCRHRADQPHESVECDLCGERRTKVPVYRCRLHGECTERPYGTRTARARQMPCCLGCDDYLTSEDALVREPFDASPNED